LRCHGVVVRCGKSVYCEGRGVVVIEL